MKKEKLFSCLRSLGDFGRESATDYSPASRYGKTRTRYAIDRIKRHETILPLENKWKEQDIVFTLAGIQQ